MRAQCVWIAWQVALGAWRRRPRQTRLGQQLSRALADSAHLVPRRAAGRGLWRVWCGCYATTTKGAFASSWGHLGHAQVIVEVCVWLMLISMVQFMSVNQMFCVEIALTRILHDAAEPMHAMCTVHFWLCSGKYLKYQI